MSTTNDELDGVAIVGMSGRFPGAQDVDSLWLELREGTELVSFFSREQLREAGEDPALIDNPRYVRARPILEDVESFDASFFGFSPGEARLVGPERRLLLEGAWQALERAGYDPGRTDASIGVFVGGSTSSYWLDHIRAHPTFRKMLDDFEMETLNDKDSLATGLSYKLDLSGPSFTVQTYCSTSLSAVHLACQSLLSGECDLALAGGVACRLPQVQGHLYREGSIRSPDGHTRTFDAKAQGTVFGNGMGIVLLERLDDALANGDHIHAVIRGSAANNDGAQKVSYSGPSLIGQSKAVAEAIAIAGVSAASIGYVEAHGTGTPVGDPVEVKALTRAFRETTEQTGYCAIGSVKSNFGHLDSASGVVGLIKATLCVEHGEIPPSLFFESPNPALELEESPFFVCTELSGWPLDDGPRRAGVSSLGVGGTNVHMVLQEAPSAPPSPPSRSHQLLLWSARSREAADRATTDLAAHLAENKPRIADAAFTLQTGRRAFEHRRALVCRDNDGSTPDELLHTLGAARSQERAGVISGVYQPGVRHIAFLFSGGGAQYPDMAYGLYQTEDVFRYAVDACIERFRGHLDIDLRRFIYPARGEPVGAGIDAHRDAARPALALPALFATEVGLARLLMSWGVTPQALLGHSVGEYAAAHLAGIFSLDDACALVALRGRLFETLPAGAMLSTPLPAAELEPLLGDDLCLASDNGPTFTVASGPVAAIEALQQTLADRGIEGRRLRVDTAAHSAMLDPILNEFRSTLARMHIGEPNIPVVSCTTGAWLTADEARDPDYWVRHLRHTVRFKDGLSTLLDDERRLLLEVGPGQTLATFARAHPDRKREQRVMTTVRHPKDERADLEVILGALGNLWVVGVDIDEQAFWGQEARRKVPLPTYPFERERHWIERPSPVQMADAQIAKPPRPDEKQPIDTWFYEPRWAPASITERRDSFNPRSIAGDLVGTRWLLFADGGPLRDALVTRLLSGGASVITVATGPSFARISTSTPEGAAIEHYQIAPDVADDYRQLLRAIAESGVPDRVIHTWSVADPALDIEDPVARFTAAQSRSFYSLLYLAQAMHHDSYKDALHIDVVGAGVHAVRDDEECRPEHATLLACCRVLPQEVLALTCRFIDIESRFHTIAQQDGEAIILANRLLTEFLRPPAADTVAWRGDERLVLEFARFDCPSPTPDDLPLRDRGVYLITGGLGDIGLAFAEHLAHLVDARLVLTSRSGLPERDQWDRLLAESEERSPITRRIQAVRAIEEAGGQVSVVRADSTDVERMREIVAWCHEELGGLHGVIHSAGMVEEYAFKAVLEADRDICESHFAPKVHGLLAIDQLLSEMPEEDAPDFVLLMSSISSLLGGLGHMPYAASNLVLDGFAQSRRHVSHPRWISVGWDIFRFGKTRDLERIVGATVTAVGRTLEGLGITREEGNQSLERSLACNRPYVIVSTGDLYARYDQWIRLESLGDRKGEGRATDRRVEGGGSDAGLSSVQAALRQIWRDILGVDDITVHDDFFELGGHSLLALRLFAAIEDRYGQSLPLATLFQHPTIAKLSTLIDQQDEAISELIIPIAEDGARRPLFWVHGLGGDLLRYHPFLSHLDDEQPVFGIQAPDEPFATVEDMAATYASELIRCFPGERYALGGHSFGGSLAYALACELEARGQEVRFLGLLDTDNENVYFSLDPAFLRHASEHLGHWARAYWARPTEQKIDSIRRLGRRLGGLAGLRGRTKRVHEVIELKGYPEDRIRYADTHYKAWQAYQPQPYNGTLTLFRARAQRLLSVDPTLGWGPYADVRVVPIPGDHRTIIRGDDVADVARIFGVYLARTETSRP